jgi:hypothetical protein
LRWSGKGQDAIGFPEQEEEMIIKDKKLKKKLDKVPDADKNGDPIYKIDAAKKDTKPKEKSKK